MTVDWSKVASALRRKAGQKPHDAQHLDKGQRASLRWIARRIGDTGLVLADEVGTGKTRIACALVHAVVESGGRVAVVVPHGLMHQWVDEAQKFAPENPDAKTLTTLTEFLRELPPGDGAWTERRPDPTSAEWWLISHGFRAPQVRINTEDWRAALPGLVELMLASEADRGDKRTRLGKLKQSLDKSPDSWWGKQGRIAQDVAAGLASLPEVRREIKKRIKKLPPLSALRSGKKSAANRPLRAAFGEAGDGRPLTEEMLGLWLGDFDLLVIDEAHKGRSDLDAESVECTSVDDKDDAKSKKKKKGTVLARLVNKLLKQPAQGRRLCVTATPMELGLEDWLDLLKRARCQLALGQAGAVIKRFRESATQAQMAPDEIKRLDELCAAAREFTRTLEDFVTRRRRDEDELVDAFRAAAGRPHIPHPYRNLEPVRVAWTETAGSNSRLIDVLFAAEGMSHGARGLKNADTKNWPRAIRDAYTKLQNGHISIDLVEINGTVPIPQSGTVDEQVRRKISRVAYWYRELRKARHGILNRLEQIPGVEIDPDADHPRILAAVKEIETWTARDEKVLVFGVFVRPLRMLTDVLNVRHALRAVDSKRPLAHGIFSDPRLLGIAFRQLSRMRQEGLLPGRLSTADWPEVVGALQESNKVYERLRRGVRRAARRPVARWRADPSLLGGAPRDAELDSILQDRLVSFALDDFLRTAGSEMPPGERLEALAAEFLRDYLMPLLSEIDEDHSAGDNQAALRQDALRREFIEHDDIDNRQSLHARFLRGETRWGTRRYLQAAFNRGSGSPRVLIAQSQVGREGLNLQESCRVVLQFHAEWNPAVIEQQIGRVDRKGSLWERLFREWRSNGIQASLPLIVVRQLLFEGTYDAYQWSRVMRRQHVFDASLFGSLLPLDAWERVPEERRAKLIESAPNFSPLRFE